MISVIIPAYNVADYIEKCLSSVLMQSYKKIEIIIVDDESTDSTLAICEKVALKDTRIKVYSIANGGAAKARNFGINKAKGKYICFVDADDEIDKDFIAIMSSCLEKNDLDMIIGDYKSYHSKEKKPFNNKCTDVQILDSVDALKKFLYRKKINPAPWAKLMKKEIVQNNLFPEGMLFEDLGTTYRWLQFSQKIGIIDYVGYFYFVRTNSAQHSKYNNKKWDLIDISRMIVRDMKKYDERLVKAANNRMFISLIQLLRWIDVKKHKCEFREICLYISDLRKEIITDNSAKVTTRILALFSCFPRLLNYMGKIYDYVQIDMAAKIK